MRGVHAQWLPRLPPAGYARDASDANDPPRVEWLTEYDVRDCLHTHLGREVLKCTGGLHATCVVRGRR